MIIAMRVIIIIQKKILDSWKMVKPFLFIRLEMSKIQVTGD
jgi:hypothetical protein